MAKLTTCPSCGASGLRSFREKEDFKVGTTIYRTRVSALRCGACGVVYVDGPSMMAAEQSVARAVARSGRVSGETFAFMRTAFGWRSNEVADLLGVTPVTVSRWENGKREMDPLAWVLLAELVLEETGDPVDPRALLETVQKPPRLPRTVEIEANP